MKAANLYQHALSPWLGDADDFVLAPLEDGMYETVPVKTHANGTFEICCVPFYVYDLDRGDLVTRNETDVITGVIAKSGDCGFRFKIDPSNEEHLEKIITALEGCGAELEFIPSGEMIAVNAPKGIDQGLISAVLATFEDADYLVYETVRKSAI